MTDEVIKLAQYLSAQIDEHERYKIAGALFGHISKALSFGYLTMYEAEPDAIVFQWVFTVQGRRYSQHTAVTMDELNQSIHAQEFAKHLVLTWTQHARHFTTNATNDS